MVNTVQCNTVIQAWGGVGHCGVGWVMQGWGRVGWGGVGHCGVQWVMQGGVGWVK